MHVKLPFMSPSKPPDPGMIFRLPGKTISVETQGGATVVTLTFDDIDASDSTEPDVTAAIASPNGCLGPVLR